MNDKFEKFFTDVLNETMEEHLKTLKNQSETDEFLDKFERADFSELYQTILNDISIQMVNNAKTIMHENSIFFRNEKNEVLANINQKWSNAFVTSEAMYIMVLEAVENYSKFVNELDVQEREKYNTNIHSLEVYSW
ncbi:Uncharacterised protein [Streptococcus pasteurianus]|nr:Uncharacterised protein [Streptococcus pasteurianus]